MRRRVNFVLIFFLILSFLIFLNSKTSLVYNITGFVQNAFSYPMESLYRFKISLVNPSFYAKHEIERLKNENDNLRQKVIDSENLKKENNALADQFQKGRVETQKLLPAKVIGFSGRFDFPDSLIIDKGTSDGIGAGYAVIFEKNLVGVVKIASKSFSKVALTNNKDFSALGKDILGNAPGVLRGEGDFILFDKVAITDNLQKNDLIATSGEINEQGFGIPPDIIVGKITTVNKSENRPFQNAKVESLIDCSKLETVFVVKKLN